MKKVASYRVAALLFCLVFMPLLPRAAWAEAFPEPTDVYINDYANVITPADAQAIRGLLENVRSQTGREITVVTLDSLAAYSEPGQSLESFATALFNQWGIGKKATNDGILILFVRNDRKVRIELGTAYGSQYNPAMQDVIDNHMLPYFRNGEYSRGLYEGTRAVVGSVTKEISWFAYHWVDLLLAGLAVVCILAGISCIRSGKKGWGWIFFTVAGSLLLALLLRALFRGKRGGRGFGGGRSGGGGASGSW